MMLRNHLLLASAAAVLVGSLGFAVGNFTGPAQADGQAQVELEGSSRGQGRHRGRRGANLAAAAAELGVTEAALKTALGLPDERPEPDFAAGAALLGITETELMEALHEARRSRPELELVAQQYGTTGEALGTALGLPERPDLAAAATELGVTEEALKAALRPGRSSR